MILMQPQEHQTTIKMVPVTVVLIAIRTLNGPDSMPQNMLQMGLIKTVMAKIWYSLHRRKVNILTLLISEQGLRCWGRNSYGQTDHPEGKFTFVSVGNYHSCALDIQQKKFSWGDIQHESHTSFGTILSTGFVRRYKLCSG